MRSAWDEKTVTWNTQPSVETNEVDYSYINRSDGTSLKTKKFFITKLVKEWYDAGSTNYGLMLQADMENTQNTVNSMYAKYKSDKYNSASSSNPFIVLEYRNTKGIVNVRVLMLRNFTLVKLKS